MTGKNFIVSWWGGGVIEGIEESYNFFLEIRSTRERERDLAIVLWFLGIFGSPW